MIENPVESQIDENLPPVSPLPPEGEEGKGPELPLLDPEMIAKFAPMAKEILGISALNEGMVALMDRVDKQTETVDKLVQLANRAMGATGASSGSDSSGQGIIAQQGGRLLQEASLVDISNLIQVWKAPSSEQQLYTTINLLLRGIQLGSRFKESGITEEALAEIQKSFAPEKK